MLEQIRRYSQSIIVKIFLTILAGSFFLFFGFSYIVDRLKGNDYIVKIGNIKVSPQFFKFEKNKKLELLRRQSSEKVDEKEISGKILHQIIWENLITLAANDFGIIVSDSVMYNYISNMEVFRTEDGHFNAALLRTFLHKIQVPESVFMESSRREIKSHLMQAPFKYISFMDELDYYSAICSEKRSVKFVRLSPSSYKLEKPSDEDLEDYYNNHPDEFMVSEKRSFNVLELDINSIGKDVQLSQEEISDGARELYGEDYVEGGESEKKFLKTNDYTNLKQEKIQRIVEDITRQIEDALVSGNSVEEVAKAHNLKIINVENVGFEDEKKIPLAYKKDVLTVAFGLNEKEVGNFTEGLNDKKEMVQWLVYVNGIIPKHVEELAKAKEKVGKAWCKDQANIKNQEFANRLIEQSSTEKDLAKLASKSGLKIEKTSLFDREGKTDNKKDKNQDVVNLICVETFEKNKKDIAFKKEDNGDIIVYQLNDITHDKKVAAENKQKDYVKLRSEVSEDMYQQLIGYLSKRYKVVINYELLNKEDSTIDTEALGDIY